MLPAADDGGERHGAQGPNPGRRRGGASIWKAPLVERTLKTCLRASNQCQVVI
jgi:hypothetical protein